MRKILLFHLCLILFLSANAQLSFESTGDFGKLWDVTPDASVSDRLYARTVNNHILVSNDKGKTWEIFYSFENSATSLNQFRLLPGGKSFSFAVFNAPDMANNGLYVVDMESKDIIRHFVTPDQFRKTFVVSYDIYDAEASRAVINTAYIDPDTWSQFTEVYFTQNGGKDFNMIYYSSDHDGVHIANSFFHPDDPKKIYLARSLGAWGKNGGLYISPDEGQTWREELAGKGSLNAVAFNPKNHNEFFLCSYINFGEAEEAVFQTLDSGHTFKQIPVTFTTQTLDNVIAIQYDPGNAQHMWMLEENEILKSADGGQHWTSTVFEQKSPVYASGTSLVINPKNGNDILVFSDAWPQRSRDGGKTFERIALPFHLVKDVALGSRDTSKQLYYSCQGGYTTKNLANGEAAIHDTLPFYAFTYENYYIIPDTTVQGRVFFFRPADEFLNPSELYYSDDYGATRTRLPSDDYATGLDAIRRDPNHKNRYWVSYSFYNSFSALVRLDFPDPSRPEHNPVAVTGNSLLTDIYVPKGDGQTLFITVGARVYISTDGGITWGEKSKGLDDLIDGYDMIWDLDTNPFDAQSMAVATTLGIYQTTDGGENWTRTLEADGLRKIAYSGAVNGHLLGASYTDNTHDTRLVFSTNKGAKWSNVPASAMAYIACGSSMDFRFYEDRVDVYLASSDLGVVKYQLTHLLSPELIFLNSFTGRLQGHNAFLEWRTQNEEGLLHYELERSTNNKDFTLINTQQATNSNGRFYYNHEDLDFWNLAANAGNIYYRLKLVSEDNSFSYSDTVKLSARDMYIYPVPATDVINLHIQGVTDAAKFRILLVDVSGRQYSIQQYNIPTGQTTINMPISRLSAGVYFMLVETRPGGEVRKFKFIKL
jgi:xyloglucan-specific exo-beta-1,4-glucanase